MRFDPITLFNFPSIEATARGNGFCGPKYESPVTREKVRSVAAEYYFRPGLFFHQQGKRQIIRLMNMQNIILFSADARKGADSKRPPLPDFAKPSSEVGKAVSGPKRKAPYFDARHIFRNTSPPADDMDFLTPAGQFAGYFPYEGFHSPETTSCGQVIHGDFHNFISRENL
jgi:hypothetical protein